MQNKANFQKSKMNVSIFSKMAYENISNRTLGENKPNSNPIKANFETIQKPVTKGVSSVYTISVSRPAPSSDAGMTLTSSPRGLDIGAWSMTTPGIFWQPPVSDSTSSLPIRFIPWFAVQRPSTHRSSTHSASST